MTELTPKFRAFLLAALSLAVMAPMVWVVYWPARGAMDVSHYQIGRDFINDWAGPRLAFSGQVLKLFDLRAYAHLIGVQFGRPLPFHNWSYPPTALLLLAPFAALPYFAALALWTVGFLLIYLRASLSFVAPGRRRIALVLLVFAPATLINIVAGQNGFVTAALMLGGLAALERRPLLAGLLFGLLTTKPHLGFVLAFVLLSLGAWRTIAAAVATTMALVAASVLAFGVEPWRLFLTVTRGYQTYLLHDFAGFYTPMMASVMALARFNGVGYGPAWMVQGVASLIVIAAACWAVRRTRSVAMRALVVAVATPLATPYAFNYDPDRHVGHASVAALRRRAAHLAPAGAPTR